MKHIEQKAECYACYKDVGDIYRDINRYISDGWRVHTAIKKKGHIIVIYERDLADSELRG